MRFEVLGRGERQLMGESVKPLNRKVWRVVPLPHWEPEPIILKFERQLEERPKEKSSKGKGKGNWRGDVKRV